MNRRELLKLFGVGSAVVPLVGGLPVPLPVQLVQEAKVEIIPEGAMDGLKNQELLYGMMGCNLQCVLYVTGPRGTIGLPVTSMIAPPAICQYQFDAYMSEFSVGASMMDNQLEYTGTFQLTGPLRLIR